MNKKNINCEEGQFGVVIEDKRVVTWKNVKTATEERIEQMEVTIECEKEVLKLCEKRIQELEK